MRCPLLYALALNETAVLLGNGSTTVLKLQVVVLDKKSNGVCDS